MVWNTAFSIVPSGARSLSLGDNDIVDLKTAIFERFVKEHVMNLGSGLAVEDGYHLSGSSKDYFQTVAPTLRPDGSALSADDYGRRWVHSTTLVEYIYTSSGWVAASSVTPHGIAVYTGTGTWTCPTGVTTVYLTGCAAGGKGAAGTTLVSGAGGGGGGHCYKYPVTVVPGSVYNVTLTAGTWTGIVPTGLVVGVDAVGVTAGSAGAGCPGYVSGAGGIGATKGTTVAPGNGGDTLFSKGGKRGVIPESMYSTLTRPGGGGGASLGVGGDGGYTDIYNSFPGEPGVYGGGGGGGFSAAAPGLGGNGGAAILVLEW